jgi:hypothetical protein
MMFYKTYNSNEIFETDYIRFFEVGFTEVTKVPVVEYNSIHDVPQAVLCHQYFVRNEHNTGCKVYLVKEGDRHYKAVKGTELARFMLDDYIVHKGWLLVEGK